MEIRIRINDNSATLALVGRLTAEVDYRRLHESVDGLATLGIERIVLDMKWVDFLDCSGIGHLLRCYQKVAEHGGALELMNLDRQFLVLLGRAQLLEVFGTRIAPVSRLAAELGGVRAG